MPHIRGQIVTSALIAVACSAPAFAEVQAAQAEQPNRHDHLQRRRKRTRMSAGTPSTACASAPGIATIHIPGSGDTCRDTCQAAGASASRIEARVGQTRTPIRIRVGNRG